MRRYSGVSSDAIGRDRNRGRKTRIEELARRLQQQNGGELEDWLDEAERLISREPRPYRDDGLTSAGFRLTKEYQYTDQSGQLLYQVLRYEHASVNDAKVFRQRRPDPNTTAKWLADAGLVKVPYNWPELAKRPYYDVFYVEGEKDADKLMSLGLLATTLASQKWSVTAAKALAGRNIIIIPDNDDKGRQNAESAVRNLVGFARSIRVVTLPGLGRTGDVSDWLAAGHDLQELLALVQDTPTRELKLEPLDFAQLAPETIPLRGWLYGWHYIRKFLSVLIAIGGSGKSSLIIAEVLAMISGKNLIGVGSKATLRIWYHNGEDPFDEIRRRFAAAARHHELSKQDIADRLFITSGRDQAITLAERDEHGRAQLREEVIADLIMRIRDRSIDVFVIDPFVNCHGVDENSNMEIDLVAKALARIADETNCAVMLVHHTKKGNGSERTAEDSRGAIALVNASRSVRVINAMTKQEAESADVDEQQRRFYFRADDGKSNLAPPEHARWFMLVNHDLQNGAGQTDFNEGDKVGVVTGWKYPKLDLSIGAPEIITVQNMIANGGPWRLDQRATIEPWVGKVIAQVLRLDLGKAVQRKIAKRLVDRFISEGWLEVFEKKDPKGTLREYVKAGNPPQTI